MLFWFNTWVIGCHMLAGNIMIANEYMKCWIKGKEKEQDDSQSPLS